MNPGEGIVAAARTELAQLEASVGRRLQAEIGEDASQPALAPAPLGADAVTRAIAAPSLGALAETHPQGAGERGGPAPSASEDATVVVPTPQPAGTAIPQAGIPMYGPEPEPELNPRSPAPARRARRPRTGPRSVVLAGCSGRSVIVGEELLDDLLDALGTHPGGIALAARLLEELTRGVERVDLEPVLANELDATAWRIATRALLARLYSRLPHESEFRHAVALAWGLHALAETT